MMALLIFTLISTIWLIITKKNCISYRVLLLRRLSRLVLIMCLNRRGPSGLPPYQRVTITNIFIKLWCTKTCCSNFDPAPFSPLSLKPWLTLWYLTSCSLSLFVEGSFFPLDFGCTVVAGTWVIWPVRHAIICGWLDLEMFLWSSKRCSNMVGISSSSVIGTCLAWNLDFLSVMTSEACHSVMLLRHRTKIKFNEIDFASLRQTVRLTLLTWIMD